MANEITLTTKMLCENGGLSVRNSPDQFFETQTTKGAVQACISIATSDTVISLTGITTSGWAYFKNTDATNYIEIGPTVAGEIAPMIRLKAGKSCVVPLTPAIVLRAQANTAAVRLQYTILEV